MGQSTSKILWSKPWHVGEESVCPSKLRDKTIDPGAPSYSQPLLNIYPKKPRIFSKWITTEPPQRGYFSAGNSGKLSCSREYSLEAQHHHPSKIDQRVGLMLLLAVTKLRCIARSDTLPNGKLEAMLTHCKVR